MTDGLTVYPTAQIRELIEQTIANEDLSPRAKRRDLEILQEHLRSMADRAGQYISDLEREEESNTLDYSRAIMDARENADIREEMIKRGLSTEEKMDAIGYFSHQKLDEATVDGSLEESVLGALKGFGLGLLHGPAFERMVRRDRTGRFVDQPGAPPISTAPRVSSRFTAPRSLPSPAASRPTRVRAPDKPAPASLTKRTVKPPASRKSETAIFNLDVDPATMALYMNLPESERARRIHPALTRDGQRAMNDRAFGTATPESLPTEEALDAKEDRMREQGFTDEEIELTIRSDRWWGREAQRARKYEERKVALERRADKLARQGVSENSEAENTHNAAGRTGQAAFLRYIEDALTAPSTTELHTSTNENGERVWDDDRTQLHHTIIDLLMRQRKKVVGEDGKVTYELCGDCDFIEQPDGPPQVLFTGGGYAAGKGSVRKILQKDGKVPENALVIDPDEIKAMIPEYAVTLEGDPEANMRVYEEAWEVAQELQRAAQARGINVIVDGITDTSADEVADRVKGFTDAGYENPRVVYVDIPTEEAIKRAGLRAKNAESASDRRHIPEVIMRSVHRDLAATVPGVLQKSSELGLSVEVWSNHQGKYGDGMYPDEVVPEGKEGKFRPPKLFVDAGGGEFDVADNDLYDDFLKKAHESITGVETREDIVARAAKYVKDRTDFNPSKGEPPARGETADELLGTFKDTMEKWSLPDPTNPKKRIWDAERRALHFKIRDEFFVQRHTEESAAALGDGTKENDPVLDENGQRIPLAIPEEDQREALFMAGIPASGKSSALKAGAANAPPSAVTVNTDDTREHLEEFKEMAAALDRYSGEGTHREAKVISAEVQQKALEQGNNIVVDGVGNKESMYFADKIAKMRGKGYKTSAIITDIDREEAYKRALIRGAGSEELGVEATGRFVSQEAINYYDDHVALRHLEWRDMEDLGWEAYNTDVPFGEKPILMARKVPGGTIEFIDEELYQQFIQKAKWARERAEETPDT